MGNQLLGNNSDRLSNQEITCLDYQIQLKADRWLHSQKQLVLVSNLVK